MYYVWPDLLANIKSLKQYTNPEKHGNPPLHTAKPHGYRGIPQYQNKYPKQQQKQSAQSTLIISWSVQVSVCTVEDESRNQ